MSETALAKQPLTLAEAMEYAKVLAQSDLVPTEYQGKPANCVIAIKMGEEVGLNPFQALQSIAVINGKPSLYGDAGLGIIMASEKLESIEETWDEATLTSTCTLKRKGVQQPVTRSFSIADAKRIKVWEKGQMRILADRLMYQNHPRRMTQMRARWWASRDLFADVLKGLRGAEEQEEATIIDVTPGPDAPSRVEEEFGVREIVETGPVAPEATPAPEAGATPAGTPTTAAAPAAVPEEGKSAMAVQDPVHAFEINGTQYQTKGITKDQMLDLFKLCPQANKKVGKKVEVEVGGQKKMLPYDKAMLLSKFGHVSRVELTEAEAEQYTALIKEAIGE